MEKFAVAGVNEVGPGVGRIIVAGGMEIGLFAVGDGYRAYRNLCPHAGAPICRGEITRNADAQQILRCPWHAWEFDLATGESLTYVGCRLDSFPVEVIDGQLVVTLGEG